MDILSSVGDKINSKTQTYRVWQKKRLLTHRKHRIFKPAADQNSSIREVQKFPFSSDHQEIVLQCYTICDSTPCLCVDDILLHSRLPYILCWLSQTINIMQQSRTHFTHVHFSQPWSSSATLGIFLADSFSAGP